MSGFLDLDGFPAAGPLVSALLTCHKALRNEAVAALDVFSPSPEVYIMDPEDIRLFILPCRWQGRTADKAAFLGDRAGAWRPRATGQQMVAAAPLLTNITDDPLVVNAMYSMSVPGCEIRPHIDREDAIGAVYRLHIGLDCPEGDCALIVDGERRQWENGKAMLFDSPRVQHSAYNRTGSPRMIAIIDLDREALEAG